MTNKAATERIEQAFTHAVESVQQRAMEIHDRIFEQLSPQSQAMMCHTLHRLSGNWRKQGSFIQKVTLYFCTDYYCLTCGRMRRIYHEIVNPHRS